jgi:hypothetical protein
MKYKIGYVDEDPDQVAKYTRELRSYFDVIGYEIPRGLPLNDLIDQIYDSDIDMLMIDFFLVGQGILSYNGDEVARRFSEIRPQFPMIIFTNEERDAFPFVDTPNIIYDKHLANEELEHFVQILKKNIEVYKKSVLKKKAILESLIGKGEAEGLNANEKHTLIEVQLELHLLDKRSHEIPFHLYDVTKFEELSNKAREASEYLAKIKKK